MQWQESDHARAMGIANEQNLLAPFPSNAKFGATTAQFFKKGGKYFVEITEGPQTNTYTIAHTFGHYPLQQYLVEIERGKYQVLPFSWDSRPSSLGGQEWFHIYGDELLGESDRFHWLQPLQNWNGMCADCHSTGLQRGYNQEEDSFATIYDKINVACLACHSPDKQMSDEYSLRNPKLKTRDIKGEWIRKSHQKVAAWQGTERNNQFMDACFACHSLRTPLTDGFDNNEDFLDQFQPQLLIAPFYQADGQIRDEVYVYGSFLQSKMYQAGVNCLDCHEPHSGKVKLETNGLCLQCHAPEEYQTPAHLNHSPDSPGGQCVNCHMPETTYMKVDPRRDHSFVVPRPSLSEEFGTKNACTSCHEGQSNQWASENIRKWFGPQTVSAAEKAFLVIQKNPKANVSAYFQVANDEKVSPIKRATAIYLMGLRTIQLTENSLDSLISDDNMLIRYSAAFSAKQLPSESAFSKLLPLLHDQTRVVRITALETLIYLGLQPEKSGQQALVMEELLTAKSNAIWRGEGRVNFANLHVRMGDIHAGIEQLTSATNFDTYYEVAYLNLADLFRQMKNEKLVNEWLEKGIEKIPTSGFLHFSKGLHLVRDGKKQESLNLFKKATKLDSSNEQFWFAYILTHHELGQREKALSIISELKPQLQQAQQIQQLKRYLQQN